MKLAVLAFSERGMRLAKRLHLPDDTFTVQRCPEGGLFAWTAAQFGNVDGLVFIGSCGIAVRAVAPYIESKLCDPAVVVVDESGAFAVSLLSGHIGGGNVLTKRIAQALGAICVVTTATDVNGVFAVDTWAKTQRLTIANPERIKAVSAKLLSEETIDLKSLFPVAGELPAGIALCDTHYDVLISYRTGGGEEALKLVPPVVTLGIGCRRSTPCESIEEAYQRMLHSAGCHPAAVKQVCSINLKAQEPGILEFCQKHSLPFRTFTAAELANVPGSFTGSTFVQSVAGVDNVCERSAVLGSGGQLLTKKEAWQGVTMALAIAPYTVHFGETA